MTNREIDALIAKEEHPLITVIKLKKKALRVRCHPRILAEIEKTISKRAQESVDILTKSEFGKKLLTGE